MSYCLVFLGNEIAVFVNQNGFILTKFIIFASLTNTIKL